MDKRENAAAAERTVQAAGEKQVRFPMTREHAAQLRAGDVVKISGVIYVARDAAHKRMTEDLAAGKDLPFDPTDNAVYYMGPSPARPGQVIGSAGPTTAGRMDKYTPELIRRGLRAMIGKGRRTQAVKDAAKEYGCVYLAAVGGAGALLASCIKASDVIAYPELGPEAVRKLIVEDMPAVVVLDAEGHDLYETEPARWREE